MKPIVTTTMAAMAAIALLGAGAAGAQTADQQGWGSTGNTTGAPAAGTVGGTAGGDRVIARLNGVPDIDRRSGPTQTQLELRQTALLNMLASLDQIEAVRNLRREGELYYADALSRDGGWMTVELDPNAGTIAAMR